jgi:rRNA processing protein Gar1
MSHEGGLLLSFGGSSPALDSIIIRASDGIYIGKIDGVLGNTDSPMAHVGHIDRKLDLNSLVGEEVNIRAKKPREERYPSSRDRDSRGDGRRDGGSGNFDRGSRDGGRRDGGRGNFDRGSRDGGRGNFDRGSRDGGRGNFDRGNRGRNDSNDGDWDCPKCNNSNFARRTECNRCGEPRGAGGGRRDGGRGNFDRGSRDGGRRDGGRGNFDRGSRDGGRRDGGRGNFDRDSRGGGGRDGGRGERREFSSRDDDRTKPKENNFRKSKGKRAGHAHNNAPKPIIPRKFNRNSDD